MGVLGQFRIQPRLIRSDSAIATLVERGLIAHNPHHLLVTTSAFLELAGLTDLSELCCRHRLYATWRAVECARPGCSLSGPSTPDQISQEVVAEVSLDLAMLLQRQQGFEAAKRFLVAAVNPQAKRVGARRATRIASCELANKLALDGNLEEARRYFDVGRRFIPEDDRNERSRYAALGLEFTRARSVGRLVKVASYGNYGFVSPEEALGQDIFLHKSEVVDPPSVADLESLKGRMLSFFVEDGRRGLEARRARLIR